MEIFYHTELPYALRVGGVIAMYDSDKEVTVSHDVVDMLKMHEGFRSTPYFDSVGISTIGYGFNLQNGLTERESSVILGMRVKRLRHVIPMSICFFKDLSPVRQDVIVNMTYNLGMRGMLKFKRMLAAMKKKHFHLAAIEMLDSLWAIQVGDEPGQRAYDLAIMMCEG